MTDWRKSTFSGGNSNCVEVAWRKSSFSGGNSDCVEVAWRKSSFSSSNSNCVEVAPGADRVRVRDSKNATGPILVIPASGWTRLHGWIRVIH